MNVAKILVALRRVSVTLAFLALWWGPAVSQTSRPPSPNESVSADKGSLNGEEGRSSGSIEDEMRAKRAIKYAEKEHRENVDRAHEISTLGIQLQEAFKEKNTIDREAAKRLDRLEKLTKKLRSEAGGAEGAEDDGDRLKPPPDLATAVARLARVADSLAANVEKTPRQVISTTVIDEANVLLELIRVVRTLTRISD